MNSYVAEINRTLDVVLEKNIQLEAEIEKLVQYIRATKSIDVHAESYQALSDGTRKAIENV